MYSSILLQRLILIFVIILFYLLLLSKTNITKIKLNLLCIIYILFMFSCAFNEFSITVINDIYHPYSSAKEMATYINENLPEDSTILIDASIIGQSIVPYLDTAKFYDITYDEYVTCANVSHDRQKIKNALNNLEHSYSGYYLIVCNNFVFFDFDIIFETTNSLTNELYTLYYIQ